MEKRKEYGALWAKTGAKGDYFSGTLEINGEKVPVVAFYNANKKNPNEPDYRIVQSIPKAQTENAQPELDESNIPF
jgi:uncharacterized protein (DUF736 family)